MNCPDVPASPSLTRRSRRALIFLLAEDWVGLGFHGFALFFLVRGLRASFALAKLGPPQAAREAEAVP